MKLFISLCVLLAFVAFGLFLYKKSLKKQKFYVNFLQFCQNAQTEISFFQNKIKNILDKQEFDGDFLKVLKAYESGNIKTVLDEITYLQKDEKERILLFFSKLGRTDSKTEKSEIQTFIKYLEEKIENIKNNGMKKSGLKAKLVVMLGLCLFVIML